MSRRRLFTALKINRANSFALAGVLVYPATEISTGTSSPDYLIFFYLNVANVIILIMFNLISVVLFFL